jgi:peptidyl-prolyl cis-trans isomerase D
LTVVVRLDSVDPADPADPAMVAERLAIAERAGSGIAQDVYGAFAGAVQARTEVRLDEAAIAAVNANFQ